MKLRKTKNKLVKKEFLLRLFVKLGTKKTRIGMRGMQGTRGMFKMIPENIREGSWEYSRWFWGMLLKEPLNYKRKLFLSPTQK